MTDRADLLERLKAATGPDRALDRELMLFEVPEFPRAVADLLEDEHFTPLTSSLDAALALVERLIPETYWHVGTCAKRDGKPDTYSADLSIGGGEHEAPTAPLAVLCALLSALPPDSLGQEETGK